MSENMIGIKQADGSFYPIMKEGEPAVKELELTTVRDDQTTIQLNLYKSATGTMKDAVYVDTLLIENLNPHPQGEPSINLQLNLDDEGNLSAQIDDPETGGHSDHTVSLVTLDSAALNSEPDYNLPDDSDYGSPSDFADLPPMDSDFDLADVLDGADGFDLPEDDDFSIGTDTAGEVPLAEEDSDFSLDDILSDIGELPPLDDMDFDIGPDVTESVGADGEDFAADSPMSDAGGAFGTDSAVNDVDKAFEAAPADDTGFAVDDADSVFAAAPVSEEAPAEDTDMLGLGDFDLPDMDSVDETSLSDFDIGSDASESVAADDTDFAVNDADGVFEAAPADDTDFAVNDADRAFESAPAASDDDFAVNDVDRAFEVAPAAADTDFAVGAADEVFAAAPVSEEATAEDTDMLGLGDFDLPDMASVDETSLSDFDTGSDVPESVAAEDTDFAVNDTDSVIAAAPVSEEATAEDTDMLGLGDFDLPDMASVDETSLSDFDTGSDASERVAADDADFAVNGTDGAFEAAPADDDTDFAVDDAGETFEAGPADDDTDFAVNDTDGGFEVAPVDDTDFAMDDADSVIAAAPVSEEAPEEDTDMLGLGDFDLPDMASVDETSLSDFDIGSDASESVAADDTDFAVNDADETPDTMNALSDSGNEQKPEEDLFAGIGDLSDDTAASMWGNSDNDYAPENKGDFDLPDMNGGLSDSFGSGDNLVYSETSFDDGLDFDTSGLDGNTDDAPFSFDDLSDFDQIPETAEPEPYAAYSPSFDNDLFAANLEEAERHNRRLLLPVIICVVCAIISVAVLGITLFTLWGSKPEEDEVAEEIVVTTEETEFQRPVAKENEIIVSDQVFLPSFLQTEEKTADAKNVQPGVSDGTDYGNASQRTDNTIFLNSGSVFAGTGYSGSASSMELALQGQYVRYKVKWGDTLWDIANSYYRNPWLYWRIAMVNNITNPNKIVAGSYIIIPE